MCEIIPQSICSRPDLNHLVDIPYCVMLIQNSVYTSRALSSPPSPPIRLIFCTLSFYSPRPGILCPGTCGYFMDLPEYYKRKRIWLFMTPTNSSCQSTLTHLILVPPSHWLVSFHVTMSLSTQLSIDSESTWHDEDIEVDSEDWILSQVTIEILNAVNNLKGEER